MKLLCCITFALLGTQVTGLQEWIARLPNGGSVSRNGVAWPASGHTTPTAPGAEPPENQFGKDFEDIGNERWNVALCRHDSDNDGYTNGEELGDPDCVWKEGDTPNRTHTISHPSYADSTPIFTPEPPTPSPGPIPDLSDATVYTVGTSQTASIQSGKMTYSWTLDTAAPDILITMSANADHYVSIGVSPKLMDGPMVACYVNAAGTAKCSDWMGVGLAITAMTQFTTIVSSSRNGNGYTITIRCPISSLTINPWTTQRVIFAIGGYNINTNIPAQHGAGAADRSEAQVDFYSVVKVSGTTPQPTTPPPTTTTAAPPTPSPGPIPDLSDATVYTVGTSQTASIQSGKMTYSWTLDTAAPDILITMSANADHYVSIGVSPKLMDGPMVACYVNAAGTAKCSDWMGVGLAITTMTQFTTIVSSSVSATGGYTITIRCPISSLNISPWNSQRVIFAIGSYNIDTNIPAQHGTGAVDRSEAAVDFYSVVTVAGPTPQPPAVNNSRAVTVDLPANAAKVLTSAEFVSPAEGIRYSWSVYSSPTARQATASDIIEVTMALDRDQYVSIGVSPQLMDGPMVACYVDPSTSQPYCTDWMGVGLTITTMTQVTQIVSSSVTASGGFTVTCRFKASDYNVVSGSQRVIFATGPYSTLSDTPGQHDTVQRSSVKLDFYTGTVTDLNTNKGFRAALIVICVVSALMLIIAAIFNLNKTVFRPRVSLALRFSVNLVFIFFLALYFGLNLRDYQQSVRSFPVGRALGDCAVLAFWFVLWPTPKHLGLPTVTGHSWERLLTYHIWVGTATFLFTTAHFIVMAVNFTDVNKQLFATDGPFPVLYGFIAWVMTTILVLSSLFLRRKFYALFRLLHWLYIPIMVFSVLHYKKLLWAFLPPAVNLFVDYLVRMYRHLSAGAAITAVSTLPTAKTTVLKVAVKKGAALPSFGEYVHIGLSGARNPHPYTVAWVDKHEADGKDPELLILVKSMGEGTWSEKVFELATEGQIAVGSSVLYMGPYGSLQVPLGKVQHSFLVCGGIGVTPMLGLLQELANHCKGSSNGTTGDSAVLAKTLSVTVVWALRDVELLEAVANEFVTSANALRAQGIAVHLQAHITTTGSEEAGKKAGFTIIQGRPNMTAILGTICPDQSETAGVYVCGPDGLMDNCNAAANQRPNTYFHSELFEF